MITRHFQAGPDTKARPSAKASFPFPLAPILPPGESAPRGEPFGYSRGVEIAEASPTTLPLPKDARRGEGEAISALVARERLVLSHPAKTRGESIPAASRPPRPAPLLSVVILNYNGAPWLQRCLESLQSQTLADRIEVIVADNASPDKSERLASGLMREWPQGRTLQLGANLGYSEGNNRAAAQARGRYLFFLNNDTWLEQDCLELLMREVEAAGAAVATPLVLDYVDGVMQSAGEAGFDAFGLLSGPTDWSKRREIFVASGPSLLIETALFRKVGGFDPEFFLYADEYDFCWRAWTSGAKVILAPSARVHHRGAAAVNPLGCEQMVENRTSDTKRFYANRNTLLVLLKNSRHLLLALVPLQLLLLATEALAMGLLTRRWSHVRRAYCEAVLDCWRLRGHILEERRRLRPLRKHGDLWMLRFLRPRLNRWRELRRFRRFGLPKVDAR
jgi:GT2 family glycosyltransferase